MLSYFRINDPYRLLAALIIFLLLCLPWFINGAAPIVPESGNLLVGQKVAQGFQLYSHIIDNTAPLTAWISGLMVLLFGHSLFASRFIAFLLLFIQGAYFGVMLINRKVFTETTFIPSLIFLILATFSFDMITLTGTLLGAGIMLVALNILLREIEFGRQRDENVLNVGVLISIASMLDFSFVLFVPGCIAILLFFTRVNLRKHLLLIVGFLLPHALLVTIYFMKGVAHPLWQFYYKANLVWYTKYLVDAKTLLWLGGIPLIYLLSSAFALNRSARVTKYQSQLLQVTVLWTMIALVQILYSKQLRPQSLVMLIAPFSFFITHFLLLIRRRRFAEMNTWAILIGIVLVAQLGRYGKIKSIDYSGLYLPPTSIQYTGKRILILADSPEGYWNNIPATGFINWRLAAPVFRYPSDYRNLALINKVFTDDLPDIILDPSGLLEPILERIPTLKQQYAQEIPGEFRRRSSN